MKLEETYDYDTYYVQRPLSDRSPKLKWNRLPENTRMETTKNRRIMKKYYVARVYDSGIMPTIVFSTDSCEDADLYAAIMKRNEDRTYIVLALA